MKIPYVSSVQVQNNAGTSVQNNSSSPNQINTPTTKPNEDKISLGMQETCDTGIFEKKPSLSTKLIFVGYANHQIPEFFKSCLPCESCLLYKLDSKLQKSKNPKNEIRLVLNPNIKKDLESNKKEFLETIKKYNISILDTKFFDQMDDCFQSFYPNYFSLSNDFFKNVKVFKE
jgi:hypothetical protein